MKNKDNLDERQLQIRGNVFKHGIILFVIFLLADMLLKDFGIMLAAGRQTNLLIINVVVMVVILEFIYHEIFPIGQKYYFALYILFGVLGFILFAMCMFHFINGELFLINNTLSDNGAHLVSSITYIIIFIGFAVRQIYNKSNKAEEE